MVDVQQPDTATLRLVVDGVRWSFQGGTQTEPASVYLRVEVDVALENRSRVPLRMPGWLLLQPDSLQTTAVPESRWDSLGDYRVEGRSRPRQALFTDWTRPSQWNDGPILWHQELRGISGPFVWWRLKTAEDDSAAGTLGPSERTRSRTLRLNVDVRVIDIATPFILRANIARGLLPVDPPNPAPDSVYRQARVLSDTTMIAPYYANLLELRCFRRMPRGACLFALDRMEGEVVGTTYSDSAVVRLVVRIPDRGSAGVQAAVRAGAGPGVSGVSRILVRDSVQKMIAERRRRLRIQQRQGASADSLSQGRPPNGRPDLYVSYQLGTREIDIQEFLQLVGAVEIDRDTVGLGRASTIAFEGLPSASVRDSLERLIASHPAVSGVLRPMFFTGIDPVPARPRQIASDTSFNVDPQIRDWLKGRGRQRQSAARTTLQLPHSGLQLFEVDYDSDGPCDGTCYVGRRIGAIVPSAIGWIDGICHLKRRDAGIRRISDPVDCLEFAAGDSAVLAHIIDEVLADTLARPLGDFLSTLADDQDTPPGIWPRLLAQASERRVGTKVPSVVLNGLATSTRPELLELLFRDTAPNAYDDKSVAQAARRKLAALARLHLADNTLTSVAYLQLVYAYVASCPNQGRVPPDSLIDHPAIRSNAAALERLALGYLGLMHPPCEEYALRAVERLSLLPDAPDSTLVRMAASLKFQRPRFSVLLDRSAVRRSAAVWATRASAAMSRADSLAAREAIRRLIAIPRFPVDSLGDLLVGAASRLINDRTGLRRQFAAHPMIRRHPTSLMILARSLPLGAERDAVFDLMLRAVADTTIPGRDWARAIRLAGSDNPPTTTIERILARPRRALQPEAMAEVIFSLRNAKVGMPSDDPRRVWADKLLPSAIGEWELAVRDPHAPEGLLVATLRAYRAMEASVRPLAWPIMVALTEREDVRRNPAALAALTGLADDAVRKHVAKVLSDH